MADFGAVTRWVFCDVSDVAVMIHGRVAKLLVTVRSMLQRLLHVGSKVSRENEDEIKRFTHRLFLAVGDLGSRSLAYGDGG